MALGTLSVFVIFSMLLLGPVTVSQLAFADGGGPDNCKNADFNTAGGTTVMQSADSGMKISGVCIKTGNAAFVAVACNNNDDKHSCLLQTQGMFFTGLNNCYKVEGIGTVKVTVTTQSSIPGNFVCHDVSHLDVFQMDMPTTPPGGFVVGGEFIGIDTTAVLMAGAQSSAVWMIPVILAAAGIGIVIARKF